MKRNLLISITSLWLLTANVGARAQTDVTQQQLDKGVAASQSGNADSAERAFQKAFDLATANNDQSKLCQAAFQLGIVQTGLHRTAQAETNLKTALDIAQRAMPANSPFTALALTLLADLYLTEDKPAQAEELYVKAIPNLPVIPPNLVAEKTINLATCYVRGDKLDLADATYGKGLQRVLTSDPQSMVPSAGQVILCSSAKSQVSWESKQYPNGVFTKRLIEALSLKGDNSSINDAYAPLRASVESEVLKDRGEVQTPQISGKLAGSLMKATGP